jgi:NAD-dependent SIR2 family protein deacetylase
MSSPNYDYLDGNAAAGELSKVFAIDVTTAQGRCVECGTTKRLAEAHLYMDGPGLVARCPACQHVLLRLVSVREHMFLDIRGMTYLRLDTSRSQENR